MNIPNKLTLLRVCLTPVFLLLLTLSFPYHTLWALAVFCLAALTDLLDGHIARKRNLVTNFGKFLDPLADKALTTAALIAFLAMGRIDIWAVMLVLIREFMVMSIRLIAAKNGVVVAADIFGKAKTVAQFASIIVMLCAIEFASWQQTLLAGAAVPDAVYDTVLLVAQILIWISVVMTVLSGFRYVWLNRHFIADGIQ
ncbi:MAG: CDP-diacylglycerol--glycerol-3-phosphate 3-phosphatidyltransferase [Clostridia bacterium]|nr:CDP-diacylglycerol--glycerol-3-phosphate 3-phosphatidyltransferase [Clostridia bacterium]